MAKGKKGSKGLKNIVHAISAEKHDGECGTAVSDDMGVAGTFGFEDIETDGDDSWMDEITDTLNAGMTAEQISEVINVTLATQTYVVIDIETGPRPWEEIECFYEPPKPLPPWDDSMCKYGNARREELRQEKLQEQRAAYECKLADEVVEREKHRLGWLEKAALSPVTGRVLLIGVMLNDGVISMDSPNERDLLESFWAAVEAYIANKTIIVGHNSNGFDIPFLIRRSWSLGVDVPRDVVQGRYLNPLFRDTLEEWNRCGGRGWDYVSLDTLAKLFGMEGKTEGFSGKDFSKWWFGEMPEEECGNKEVQREKAIEYNRQDLIVARDVADRMGVI